MSRTEEWLTSFNYPDGLPPASADNNLDFYGSSGSTGFTFTLAGEHCVWIFKKGVLRQWLRRRLARLNSWMTNSHP
jgi:hypothetical protein